VFKVSKGAPHVLLHLVGHDCPPEIKSSVERDVLSLGERGIRCLAVAKTDPSTQKWAFMGLLTFLDPPRPDTKQVILLTTYSKFYQSNFDYRQYLMLVNMALL
jgi:H+-transporting ATPase